MRFTTRAMTVILVAAVGVGSADAGELAERFAKAGAKAGSSVARHQLPDPQQLQQLQDGGLGRLAITGIFLLGLGAAILIFNDQQKSERDKAVEPFDSVDKIGFGILMGGAGLAAYGIIAGKNVTGPVPPARAGGTGRRLAFVAKLRF